MSRVKQNAIDIFLAIILSFTFSTNKKRKIHPEKKSIIFHGHVTVSTIWLIRRVVWLLVLFSIFTFPVSVAFDVPFEMLILKNCAVGEWQRVFFIVLWISIKKRFVCIVFIVTKRMFFLWIEHVGKIWLFVSFLWFNRQKAKLFTHLQKAGLV